MRRVAGTREGETREAVAVVSKQSKNKRTTANEGACYTCRHWRGSFLDWGECAKHEHEHAYSYGTCSEYEGKAER